MKIFSSLVSLKVLWYPGKTSQEFPIIGREIPYDCEMNCKNKANDTAEFKTRCQFKDTWQIVLSLLLYPPKLKEKEQLLTNHPNFFFCSKGLSWF